MISSENNLMLPKKIDDWGKDKLFFLYISTFIAMNSSGYSRALKLTNWLTSGCMLRVKYLFLYIYIFWIQAMKKYCI